MDVSQPLPVQQKFKYPGSAQVAGSVRVVVFELKENSQITCGERSTIQQAGLLRHAVQQQYYTDGVVVVGCFASLAEKVLLLSCGQNFAYRVDACCRMEASRTLAC